MNKEIDRIRPELSLVGIVAIFVTSVIEASSAVIRTDSAPIFSSNYGTGTDIQTPLDLNGDGAPDFFLNSTASSAKITAAPGWEIYGKSLVDYGYDYPYEQYSAALPLNQFSLLGPGSGGSGEWFSHPNSPGTTGDVGAYLLGYSNRPPSTGFGGWYENLSGYLGFRFLDNGEYHYGWIRISFATNPFTGRPERGFGQSLIFDSWEWESEGNAQIVVDAVPEPSAALLIFVASLSLGLRRNRQS